MVFSFVLITFDPILDRDFLRFSTNPEIQDGGPRWPPFRNDRVTQLLHHATSSPHEVDFKGDIFRRTIYPPNLGAIPFIFSELWRREGGGGWRNPRPIVEDQKRLV